MRNKPYPLYSLPEIRDLKDMVRRRAVDTPDATAFFYSAGRNKNAQKTCREFSDDIDALGTFLYENGYKNSHIAIIGENSYEWLAAFLAIVNGGNVAVPIDKEQTADKIRHLLQQSDCEAVFVSKNYAELVEEVDDITVFYISDFSEYIAEGRKLIDSGITEYTDYTINNDKLAAIFFTSGTTGSSKGVMLNQKNMIYNVCVSRKSVEIKKNGFRKINCVNAYNTPKYNNTKIAVKQGNAEERPDAGCRIYGKSGGNVRRLCSPPFYL